MSFKEFIYTYGWAILIILTAVAALAYFILNPATIPKDEDKDHLWKNICIKGINDQGMEFTYCVWVHNSTIYVDGQRTSPDTAWNPKRDGCRKGSDCFQMPLKGCIMDNCNWCCGDDCTLNDCKLYNPNGELKSGGEI